MKVSIIIAVYNEARTVIPLLERVWAQPLPAGTPKEIIIVESNSTDGSRELIAAFLANKGQASHAQENACRVHVVHEDKPQGKGYAVRTGMAAATGDILLIQDADLEYDVGDYPALVQPILDGRTPFVLGSRCLGANSWQIRRLENKPVLSLCMNLFGLFLHTLFNTLYGTRLTDPTTMYKVFRADCIRGMHFTCNRFDFDWELMGNLVQAGFVPLEVPVSYEARGFGDGKKIRPFRDPPTWIAAILKNRFFSAGSGGLPLDTLHAPHSEKPARRASS